MSYFICVVGEDELDELCMLPEDVNSDDSFVVVFICAENSIEVLSLFEVEQF